MRTSKYYELAWSTESVIISDVRLVDPLIIYTDYGLKKCVVWNGISGWEFKNDKSVLSIDKLHWQKHLLENQK